MGGGNVAWGNSNLHLLASVKSLLCGWLKLALNFERIISLKKLGKGNPTPWNKAAKSGQITFHLLSNAIILPFQL